jgi:hypothetical protein
LLQLAKEITIMYRTVLAILLLFGTLGNLAGCRKHEGDGDHDNNQEKRALNPPKEPGKRPLGMTAIKANPGDPQPFSKTDVVAYFKTHNLPRNAGTTAQFSVQSLEFITSAEVSKRLEGVLTGLQDNERVGFVTLVGTFIFTGPPSAKPAFFRQAYAVFDAVSGNLLLVGSLGRAEESPNSGLDK